MSSKHFLSLLDFSAEELHHITERAAVLKQQLRDGQRYQPLVGKTAALILQLSSTRTRVGFETGMHQLGGHCIFLNDDATQLGRGEPIADAARVLGAMVDITIIRTLEHADVETFAAHSRTPVINAMTRRFHPCQLLADIQTYNELRGSIEGRTVAFIGDGYNMCHSYINAAQAWGFKLKIATPEGYRPDPAILASTNLATLVESPREAAENADLIVTDVWSSMGHEGEESSRLASFNGYQVNEALLDYAKDEVLFMHCLPAHRGEEVNETVLDDPRSAVWVEAENRLHSQKALLEFMLVS